MADIGAGAIEPRGRDADGPAGMRAISRRRSSPVEQESRAWLAAPSPRWRLRRLDGFARGRGFDRAVTRPRATGTVASSASGTTGCSNQEKSHDGR